MKITMVNIGRYVYQEYELGETGQIITITGRSGRGKSTIFMALMWAIYGEAPQTLLRHGLVRTDPAGVVIEWGELYIARKKHPECLEVRYGGREYMDTQAEALLSSLFGTSTIIPLCSHLTQKDHHPMIDAPAKERMAVLRMVSRVSNNIEEAIDTASQKIKYWRNYYMSEFGAFNEQRNQFTAAIHRINWQQWTAPEGRAVVQERLNKLIVEMQQSQIKLHQQIELKGKVDTLRQQLEKIPSIEPQGTLEQLETELQQAQQMIEQWGKYHANERQRKQHQNLTAELTTLVDKLPAELTGEATLPLLPELVEQWSRWRFMSEVQELLASAFSPMETLKDRLRSELTYRRCLPQQQQLNKLRTTLQEKANMATMPPVAQLRTMLDGIKENLRATRPRACPKCQSPLLEQSGNLALYEGTPLPDLAILQNQVTMLNTVIPQREDYERNVAWLAEQEKHLPTDRGINCPTWDKLTNAQLEKALELNFTLTKPTVTVEQLQQSLKVRDIRKSLQHFTVAELTAPAVTEMELQRQMTTTRSAINQWRQAESDRKQRSEVQIQLSEVETKAEDPNVIKTQLDGFYSEIQQIQANMQLWAIGDELLVMKTKVEQREVQINEIKDKMEDWIVIQKTLIEAEFDVVRRAVDKINDHLHSIIAKLFRNVTFQITLEHELKNLTRKMEVGILMTYTTDEGHVVKITNLRCASGGEMKRLSLALTLAFRSIFRNPILCLDEVFSSLDGEFCSISRDAIADHLDAIPGIVLIINHHDSPGGYGHHVKVT